MKKIITLSLLLAACALSTWGQGNMPLRKLQMAEFAISRLYVDSVDEDKMVESAIIEMLAQLDPHSTYNNAEEVRAHPAGHPARQRRTLGEGRHPGGRPHHGGERYGHCRRQDGHR